MKKLLGIVVLGLLINSSAIAIDKSITLFKYFKPLDNINMSVGASVTDSYYSLKKHLTCNRSFYPPEGTQKEQSLEIFADWFSAEVFAHSEYSSEFPRPDLCAKRPLSEGSSYLPNATRLNKIYFAHPKLTKDKDSSDYCALNP